MKIVTGHKGTPHITSNDDMGLHQGIVGTGNYVLKVGNELAAAITDATTVSIQDGEGLMQGVHFRVLPGTVDTVQLTSGVVGYQRIDLICARYTKDSVTGYEDVQWVVITGTPAASNPAVPAYNDGDILGGDLIVDYPMYKVTWNELTPTLETLTTDNHQKVQVFRWDADSTTERVSGSKAIEVAVDPGVYVISFVVIYQNGNTISISDGTRNIISGVIPDDIPAVFSAVCDVQGGKLTFTFYATREIKYSIRCWGVKIC